MYSSGSSVDAMRAVARRITDERGMRRLRLCVARYGVSVRGGPGALAFLQIGFLVEIPVCAVCWLLLTRKGTSDVRERVHGMTWTRATKGVAAFPPCNAERAHRHRLSWALGHIGSAPTTRRCVGPLTHAHICTTKRSPIRARLFRRVRVRARPLTDALLCTADDRRA